MEELELYKEWCLVFVHYEQEYFIANAPNNSYKIDLINDLKDLEQRILTYYKNKNIRMLKIFAKSFANDMEIDNPSYPILNVRLRAACGKDLRDFDKKRLERVKKVEERGYIKTDSEFYLIRNHIDYLEATNATDEEIIKFDTLITLYEEKIKEKMERQRKKQNNRGA